MSAAEIIDELPKLTDAERREVLRQLLALVDEADNGQRVSVDRLEEDAEDYRAVNLQERGISEVQAADLRGRLKAFAEDWERPEAAIYDEDSPR